jgi:hypothetical protein
MSLPLGVSVFGQRLLIEFDESLDDLEAARISAAWVDVPGLATGEQPQRTIAVGRPNVRRTLDLQIDDVDELASTLTSVITLMLLDGVAGSLLLFHAAGIADEEGRVIAFVGPSGRGKTTAARTLARDYAYVTDETVAVDDAGGADRVLPYRKPLSVIVDPGLPKQQISSSTLGLQPLPDARLRMAALVLLQRDESHVGAAVVEPVSLVDAIPELVPQTSYLARTERPLQRIAQLADRHGGFRLIRYGEAETLHEAVGPLFAPDSDEASSEAWEPFVAKARLEEHAFGDVVDAIRTDDALLVLTSAQLIVLTGLGPTVCEAVADGRSLVEHVVEVHGEPPAGDAAELVAACVDELVSAGVLRVG